MDPWLSHTLTGVLCGLAGSLFSFVLRWRQQAFAEWKAITDDLRRRVIALEAQVKTGQDDHRKCLETQGELRAKVAELETELRTTRSLLEAKNG
jgi:hypothetical protein